MTPYYHYGMYMCGYPKVLIRGTKSDWVLIIAQVMKLGELLDLNSYVNQFIGHLSMIEWNTGLGEYSHEKEYFKDILVPKRCGSGSQEELSGWFTDFYIEKPSFALAQNFPTHIANVPFKYINSGTNHVYLSGLFKSHIVDGFLIPEFDSQILNIKEKQTEEPVEREIIAYRGVNNFKISPVLGARHSKIFKDELPEMGIDIVKSEVKPDKILTSDASGAYFLANYVAITREMEK